MMALNVHRNSISGAITLVSRPGRCEKGFRKPDPHSAKETVAGIAKTLGEVKHNEHMRKHGFERGFIDCRTLKEQGIERRPEVHLGFEAAGRLDDAQRHDIMQKRSEPDYYRHLEQARMVGHDIREWLDTPVKQRQDWSEGCNMILRGNMALT